MLTGEINPRLELLFQNGCLIKPCDEEKLSFLDLSCVLAHFAGMKLDYISPLALQLEKLITTAERYVFVLVDGMGINQIERHLPSYAFLRENIVCKLRSVFLSTTSAALTSLAVCRWPAEHGILAWWTYCEKLGHGILPLPFVEQDTNVPLQNINISETDIFPLKSVWGNATKKILSVVPMTLKDSIYTRYSAGNTPIEGYVKLNDAFDMILSQAKNTDGPQFIYLYIPHFDEVSHEKGSDSDEAKQVMIFLNENLDKIRKNLPEEVRLIITADHGQTNVPPDGTRIILKKDDPITSFLRCRPTGESCVPFFHVKAGHEAQFYSHFMERFGQYFELIEITGIEKMKLFGPVPLSETTKKRLGTFIGISVEPAKFYIEPLPSSASHIGIHGGLSPDEMIIPLILS